MSRLQDQLPEGEGPALNSPTSQGLERRASWRSVDLVAGIAAVLVLFFVLYTALVSPAVAVFGEDSPEALLMQGLTVFLWDLGIVGIVHLLIRRRGASWRQLGWRLPQQEAKPIWNLRSLGISSARSPAAGEGWVRYLVLSSLSGYATAYALVALYSLALTLLGLDFLEPSQQIPDAFYDHAWLLAVIGASVVITAPIAEEVLFRGFIFGGLRRGLAFVPAALLSGFLFSLGHTDPGLVIPFTLVGMVLAYTYERSGSLYTSIGVHFIFNAVSFVALVLVPGAR
jgi:membrane protease YdiL (CAAX protease family)